MAGARVFGGYSHEAHFLDRKNIRLIEGLSCGRGPDILQLIGVRLSGPDGKYFLFFGAFAAGIDRGE